MNVKVMHLRSTLEMQGVHSDAVATPEGYKRVEQGVIPIDWHTCTVGDCITFEGGSQPDKSFFRLAQKPGYCRLIQIRDYKSDNFEVFVPRSLARRFCNQDDIMIGRYGPPVFQILRGLEGAYNVALIKAKPLEVIDREFAYYFLSQETLFQFIDKLSRRTSGQTGVDLKELRTYPLHLPSTLEEQRAIATVLSDVDALLEELDNLIAKKRDIKQAAMQQLLNGQTRLPGFEEKWVVRPIGEILLVRHGRDQKLIQAVDGKNPIYASGGQIGRTNACISEGPSVLIGRKGTIDKPRYVDKPFWTVDTLFYTELLGQNSAKYMFYKFCMIPWRQYNEASGVPSLSAKTIERIEVTIPQPEEQQAIASVLSEFDNEIQSLEQRRNKTAALKQAMVQELLTGRTRLI